MSTHRTPLTPTKRNARPAPTSDLDTSGLVELYFSLSIKQRREQFVDTACAAEMIDVPRRTIQSWLDAGLLQAIRIGKKYRVQIDSLRDQVRSRTDSWADASTSA